MSEPKTTAGFPFGDPCPRCTATAADPDPLCRVCTCTPCEVCKAPTGDVCAYCEMSLGCRDHKVTIDDHCATVCLATPAERDVLAGAQNFSLFQALQEKCRGRR